MTFTVIVITVHSKMEWCDIRRTMRQGSYASMYMMTEENPYATLPFILEVRHRKSYNEQRRPWTKNYIQEYVVVQEEFCRGLRTNEKGGMPILQASLKWYEYRARFLEFVMIHMRNGDEKRILKGISSNRMIEGDFDEENCKMEYDQMQKETSKAIKSWSDCESDPSSRDMWQSKKQINELWLQLLTLSRDIWQQANDIIAHATEIIHDLLQDTEHNPRFIRLAFEDIIRAKREEIGDYVKELLIQQHTQMTSLKISASLYAIGLAKMMSLCHHMDSSGTESHWTLTKTVCDLMYQTIGMIEKFMKKVYRPIMHCKSISESETSEKSEEEDPDKNVLTETRIDAMKVTSEQNKGVICITLHVTL